MNVKQGIGFAVGWGIGAWLVSVLKVRHFVFMAGLVVVLFLWADSCSVDNINATAPAPLTAAEKAEIEANYQEQIAIPVRGTKEASARSAAQQVEWVSGWDVVLDDPYLKPEVSRSLTKRVEPFLSKHFFRPDRFQGEHLVTATEALALRDHLGGVARENWDNALFEAAVSPGRTALEEELGAKVPPRWDNFNTVGAVMLNTHVDGHGPIVHTVTERKMVLTSDDWATVSLKFTTRRANGSGTVLSREAESVWTRAYGASRTWRIDDASWGLAQ